MHSFHSSVLSEAARVSGRCEAACFILYSFYSWFFSFFFFLLIRISFRFRHSTDPTHALKSQRSPPANDEEGGRRGRGRGILKHARHREGLQQEEAAPSPPKQQTQTAKAGNAKAKSQRGQSFSPGPKQTALVAEAEDIMLGTLGPQDEEDQLAFGAEEDAEEERPLEKDDMEEEEEEEGDGEDEEDQEEEQPSAQGDPDSHDDDQAGGFAADTLAPEPSPMAAPSIAIQSQTPVKDIQCEVCGDWSSTTTWQVANKATSA